MSSISESPKNLPTSLVRTPKAAVGSSRVMVGLQSPHEVPPQPSIGQEPKFSAFHSRSHRLPYWRHWHTAWLPQCPTQHFARSQPLAGICFRMQAHFFGLCALVVPRVVVPECGRCKCTHLKQLECTVGIGFTFPLCRRSKATSLHLITLLKSGDFRLCR